MTDKIEKKGEVEVILGLLQMIQFMTNAFNLEAANVLHQTGWCSELIENNNCPVCKIEKTKEEEE
tara:strand:- start:19 stop:213 length:195 start_codon:yes stop_codon:yes gene_type:complete